MKEVIIVKTGKANVASVITGLISAGAKSRLSEDADDIQNALFVVIPGVGAYGPAMAQLRSLNLTGVIKQRIKSGKPTLAICLGLQLLAEGSEENPGIEGLGIIPGIVKRFRQAPRIPQLGWNDIEISTGCKLLKPGFAYFANSYYLDTIPEGWNAARTSYGETFLSAIERDAVLACQFHPELSGIWGRDLLIRWLGTGNSRC